MAKKYNGISFPSEEEMHMYMWLEEAKKHCIVDWFEHQPETYVLSVHKKYQKLNTKLKKKIAYIDRTLLKGHVYTADFKFHSNYALPFAKEFQNIGLVVMDTKGGFQKHDGNRAFSINQKWIYSKFGTYIHKVVPQDFFLKTFVPQGARYTPKQGKIKKCYTNTMLVGDYVKILKEK